MTDSDTLPRRIAHKSLTVASLAGLSGYTSGDPGDGSGDVGSNAQPTTESPSVIQSVELTGHSLTVTLTESESIGSVALIGPNGNSVASANIQADETQATFSLCGRNSGSHEVIVTHDGTVVDRSEISLQSEIETAQAGRNSSKERLSRRKYLFAAGAASAAGVAGCSSLGGNGTANQEASDSENDTQATPTDEVGKTRLSSGETRLTVKDVVVTQTLYSPGRFSDTAVSPEAGKQFVLVDVQARKQTENGTVPAETDYRLEAGSATYSIDNIDTDSLDRPVNADLYEGGGGFGGPEVGSTTRGWLVFEVPADTSTGTLRVREMRTQNDEPVSWNIQFGGKKAVTFEEEIQLPDEAEVAATVEAKMSVTNTGGRTGRYATGVTSDLLSDSRTLEYTLEPGETRDEMLELAVDGYHEGSVDLSVGSASTETIDIVAPELQLGDTWTGPDGLKHTVSDLVFVEKSELEFDGMDIGAVQQVALARLTVTNPTSDRQEFPERYEEPLKLIRDDQTYPAVGDRDADYLEVTAPIEGSSYPRTVYPTDQGPGGEKSGIMIFYPPASVSREDVEIRYSYGGTRAIWTP